MNIEAILTLVLATVVLGATPGPVVAALVGRALFSGVRASSGMLVGVFLGDLVWLLAAVSGLGYIAATYSTFFLVIKYLGALYLMYLGVSAIRQGLKKEQALHVPTHLKKGDGFLTGLFVTLGNPKLVAFYVGFLPTFIDMQALSFIDAAVAAVVVPSTFALMNFGWVLSAAKAKTMLKSPTPLRILNLLSGGLLFGAGAFMIKEA